MAPADVIQRFNRSIARYAVVSWYLGYPPGNCHRTANGTWQSHFSGMPVKHSRLMLMAAEIAEYGPDIYYEEDAVERVWALPLDPDQHVIEPDHICAYMGLTLPLDSEIPEDDWADRAQAARSVYIQWADELWGNSTVQTMVERLSDELARRDVFLGADIVRLLDNLYATLGPGVADAPA